GADHVYGDTESDRLDLGDERPRILQAVGLRQDDLGHGAALPDGDEVAFDPARLELRAERRDHERDVDVRGESLGLRRAAGGAAATQSPSGRDDEDGAAAVSGRSYARRAASRPRWPRRRQAQFSCERLPLAGNGTRRRLGAGPPAVKRRYSAELPRDVRDGQHA